MPGLVYPANAGVRIGSDFVLSNLLPTRAGEQRIYRSVIEGLGIPCHTIERRFEGEADFFPAGDLILLTHGVLERQRFVPTWGLPPWKRIYGFRTDAGAAPLLEPWAGGREMLQLELALEAHYHGDTVLCAFGPGRGILLAYRAGIARSPWEPLRVLFGDELIALSDDDAARYAANSFALERNGEFFLVMPDGVSERLLGQVREHGVTPLTVDVSEFLKKGGEAAAR